MEILMDHMLVYWTPCKCPMFCIKTLSPGFAGIHNGGWSIEKSFVLSSLG